MFIIFSTFVPKMKRLHCILALSFCLLTFSLSAQQSCYEQYLREHDMPFLTTEDGTILADAHLALVDSTWYMWLPVDPLADKYPGNTPYMYCNGNPIMLVDPDGRKVIGHSADDIETFVQDIGCIMKDPKFDGYRGLINQEGNRIGKISRQ